jgi:hypothetical protein
MSKLIGLCAGFCAALAAQPRELPPIPRYEVHRAPAAPIIDGKLDEAAWRAAGVIEFRFPWEKQTGARQKTTARLLWNDEYLFAGYECEDSDIVAQYTQRDDPTYKDDAVELFINPDPSQDWYYGMEMNARATLYDYFYAFPRMLLSRVNFTGVHIATHIRGTLNVTGDKDEGWSLEVAIPWRNFNELAKQSPPHDGSIWTANLNRWDGTEPNRRLSLWSDSGLEQPHPHNPKRFGQLVFRGQ